jgi:hypothetical protein
MQVTERTSSLPLLKNDSKRVYAATGTSPDAELRRVAPGLRHAAILALLFWIGVGLLFVSLRPAPTAARRSSQRPGNSGRFLLEVT